MAFGPRARAESPRNIPTGVADEHPSAAAGGLRVFAGIIMLVSGLFQVLQGIAAVADDSFFANTSSTYDGNVTTWGWIHIVIGSIVALIGFGVLRNTMLGRALAIPLVVISMIGNFAFLPHYPLWAVVIIVLDVVILWALVTAPEH